MKSNNIPQIRFSGFSEDWVQRKLGEISEKVTEKNKNNIYSETLTNSAEFGIINQRDFFDKDISNEKNLDGYYVVRPDDFVYNPRISNLAPVGPIKRNRLGRTGVMSPLYYVFRTHDIDKTYLEIYLSSNNWHRFMKLNGDSGARSDRFAIKDSIFREMPIPTPSVEEQTKIGNFYEQLDELMAIYQQELTTLKQTKQGFLQKMFPKDGESVPEIRFPGFNKKWEKRNILDVSKVFIGLVTTMTENYRESGTLLIRNSDIKENRFEFSDNPIYLDESFAELNHTRRLIIGDVVTVHTGDIGTSAVITESENGSIGFATINSRPNPNLLDSNYLATFFNTERHKNYAIKMSTGDGRSNYNLKDFNKLTVPLPSIEEQKKIGLFFKCFDKTINLHQKELVVLQETKKAFLQKMFA